jgi:hypothetical protein
MGGLGNQMFQYSLYKQFELSGIPAKMFIEGSAAGSDKKTAIEDAFPEVRFVKDKNNEEYQKLTDYKRTIFAKVKRRFLYKARPVFYEKEDCQFDERVLHLRNNALIGYWQTSLYWSNKEEAIRQSFRFRNEYDEELLSVMNMISDTESVSIHIRGGDYNTDDNRKLFGDICTNKYYQNAINKIEKIKGKNLKFFVFSNDDVSDIIDNKDAVYVSCLLRNSYPDWVDMMLMSKCKNNIIANSSFSWWAAYLNTNKEKMVLAPERWINGKKTKDIWEKQWIKVGNQ